MIYERLCGIAFPHGAEPKLDDTLKFLEIASLAGTVDPSIIDDDMSAMERAQATYHSLRSKADGPETQFAAARNSEGEIIGAVSYSILPKHEFVQLETLAVLPDYRKKNIGSHLLDLAIKHGVEAGARTVLASVTKDAAPFYIKQGFDDVDFERDSSIRVYAKIINPIDPPGTMELA